MLPKGKLTLTTLNAIRMNRSENVDVLQTVVVQPEASRDIRHHLKRWLNLLGVRALMERIAMMSQRKHTISISLDQPHIRSCLIGVPALQLRPMTPVKRSVCEHANVTVQPLPDGVQLWIMNTLM